MIDPNIILEVPLNKEENILDNQNRENLSDIMPQYSPLPEGFRHKRSISAPPLLTLELVKRLENNEITLSRPDLHHDINNNLSTSWEPRGRISLTDSIINDLKDNIRQLHSTTTPGIPLDKEIGDVQMKVDPNTVLSNYTLEKTTYSEPITVTLESIKNKVPEVIKFPELSSFTEAFPNYLDSSQIISPEVKVIEKTVLVENPANNEILNYISDINTKLDILNERLKVDNKLDTEVVTQEVTEGIDLISGLLGWISPLMLYILLWKLYDKIFIVNTMKYTTGNNTYKSEKQNNIKLLYYNLLSMPLLLFHYLYFNYSYYSFLKYSWLSVVNYSNIKSKLFYILPLLAMIIGSLLQYDWILTYAKFIILIWYLFILGLLMVELYFIIFLWMDNKFIRKLLKSYSRLNWWTNNILFLSYSQNKHYVILHHLFLILVTVIILIFCL